MTIQKSSYFEYLNRDYVDEAVEEITHHEEPVEKVQPTNNNNTNTINIEEHRKISIKDGNIRITTSILNKQMLIVNVHHLNGLNR